MTGASNPGNIRMDSGTQARIGMGLNVSRIGKV